MRKISLISTVAGTALLAASPTLAQEVTPLTDFDASQIEGAWLADNMLDADVYGTDGELVGYVQNIVLSPQDRVSHVIIETDNWFDIGDRAIAIPWENVDLTPRMDGINVPLDEDEMNDFSLFADDQTSATWGDNYRASDVLSDYVSLQDGTDYGYVSDLIFNRDGDLASVLVTPDVGYGTADYAGGYYAYPYFGNDFGYDPLTPAYTLPYSEQEVANYSPYDIGGLGNSI